MHIQGKKTLDAILRKVPGDGWTERTFTAAVALILFLALATSGCGPGFPIMTAEQESLVTNVDTLSKENEALKKRIATIEEGGSADANTLGKEIERLKAALADATIGLDQVRQEFSFIKGNIEESEFERAQIKEDIKFSSESARTLNERLSAIEASLAESGGKLSTLSATIEESNRAASELRASVSSLEARVAALEGGGAGAAKTTKETTPAKDDRPGPEELYKEGYRLTKENRFAEALEVFGTFLREHPKHKLADHAQYWTGEIYYATGEHKKAILEFDKVIKGYPDGVKVPAAMLKQGYSFEKIGALKEARVLLEQVISKYPGTDEAGLAKKRLQTLEKEMKAPGE